MASRGYVAVGLEPFSLGSAFESGRLRLIRAPLQEAEIGQFEVITLWHVLEHVPRPVELLRGLEQHLAPGGALVVSVPNLQSWQGRLFGGQWFHLDAPRHLIHFEPETLRSTLARVGFAQVAEQRFVPEYGSSGWVQSSLNSVLPRKNYLYELVKDRGALNGMGRFSSAAHLAASIVGGVPLFILSLPLERLASAVNRGAALTVAARKRS
jgi:SAM-dependent methyltransferase